MLFFFAVIGHAIAIICHLLVNASNSCLKNRLLLIAHGNLKVVIKVAGVQMLRLRKCLTCRPFVNQRVYLLVHSWPHLIQQRVGVYLRVLNFSTCLRTWLGIHRMRSHTWRYSHPRSHHHLWIRVIWHRVVPGMLLLVSHRVRYTPWRQRCWSHSVTSLHNLGWWIHHHLLRVLRGVHLRHLLVSTHVSMHLVLLNHLTSLRTITPYE